MSGGGSGDGSGSAAVGVFILFNLFILGAFVAVVWVLCVRPLSNSALAADRAAASASKRRPQRRVTAVV